MNEQLYREPSQCPHTDYDVMTSKCPECGAIVTWVVPVEIDYESAIRVCDGYLLGYTDDDLSYRQMIRQAVDIALGVTDE